jgi:hypothetical protein
MWTNYVIKEHGISFRMISPTAPENKDFFSLCARQ